MLYLTVLNKRLFNLEILLTRRGIFQCGNKLANGFSRLNSNMVLRSFVMMILMKTALLIFQFNPCGNFSDTSSLKFLKTKGSIGHAFTVCIHTENQNQRSFYPFVLHEISVLIELLLGHLCYRLTDVPPQPNSPPDFVSRVEHPGKPEFNSRSKCREARFYLTK